ncbi:UDP-glucose 4-epimerase GalE [Kiloniella antarctica]|uniref:UDP-glucose 4-epimerase n=1 Tax=Kiloniella antarctica TaxID=1550907 RepID=A0ABW5BSM5_9PROT
MTTVIVTGGAGYIGSHAAKLLEKAGYNPVVYDDLSTGHEWAVKWGPLEIGSIGDSERLVGVMERYKPDAVFHFAAQCLVGESMQKPLSYYNKNVGETITLLQAMKQARCHKLIFSSSCATFGEPEVDLITEDTIQQPINPYGRSKLMIETILADAEKEFPLNSVILRYFNAAGGDPEAAIGEAHDPETHIIPIILQCALGTRDKVNIYGDDYLTPDGTCIRDYIHVTDLAEAHLLALKWLEAGKGSEHFNLGGGNGYSVYDVIEACRKITGHLIPTQICPRREGDPSKLIASVAKAKKSLCWSPKMSDISTIVADAWRWAQKSSA